jgi:hypothetical protein
VTRERRPFQRDFPEPATPLPTIDGQSTPELYGRFRGSGYFDLNSWNWRKLTARSTSEKPMVFATGFPVYA